MDALIFVRDICLLPKHPLPSIDATLWKSAGLIGKTPVKIGSGGYTIEVIKTRIVSWYRTYTHGAEPPKRWPSSAGIQIEEWLPGRTPRDVSKEGWKPFGPKRKYALVWLRPGEDYRAIWGESTRRAFRRLDKGLRFRVGTVAEFLNSYHHSQVPKIIQQALTIELDNHLRAHPETIETLIAEDDKRGVVAGLISGNCQEAQQSYYLIGYFIPGANASMSMIGLIDFWYQQSLARNIRVCNFGLITGAHPLPWSTMIGYSKFKTRFGVHRVWTPGSYWRVNWR